MQDYKAEAEKMFKKKEIRIEFDDDINTLIAYLENKHRAKVHKAGVSKHKKPEKMDDEIPSDAAFKPKWDADKALQDEFMGDFDAYLAYERNKGRVKILQ